MNNLLSVLLVLIGLIHFLPVVGVLSARKLEQLYSTSLRDNNLAILMRHRALLFGIVGGYILYSAFSQPHQWAAMWMAAISMLGFVVLVWTTEGYNEVLKKIAIVDTVCMAVLLVAIGVKFSL